MIVELIVAVVLCVLGTAARAWGLCSRTRLWARLRKNANKPEDTDGKEPPAALHGRHSVGDEDDDLTFSTSATFCPTAAGAVQPASDTLRSRHLIDDSVPYGAIVAAPRQANLPALPVPGKNENPSLAATSSPTAVPMFPSEPSASSPSALPEPFSTTLTHPAPGSKPTYHPSSLPVPLPGPILLQPRRPQSNHHHQHHHQLSRVSLDTIRQPDDQLAALQHARKVVHQASCMAYTPSFTVGRVALKIPDRHLDDLPPLETWTAPFRSALSAQGVGLLGVYVRQGCIQLVLDLVALAYGGGPAAGAAAADTPPTQVGSLAANLPQDAGASGSGNAGLRTAPAQGDGASTPLSSSAPAGEWQSDRLGVMQPGGGAATSRHVSHSAPARSRSDGNVMSGYRQRQQHRRRPARGNQSWSVDSQGHRSPPSDYLGWAAEGEVDGVERPRASAGPRCVRRSSANAAELRNYGTSSSGSDSPADWQPPELVLPPDHPLRAVLSEFPPEAWVDLLGESLGGGGQVVTVQLPTGSAGRTAAAVPPGTATWHVTLGGSPPAAPAPAPRPAAELPHLLCVSPTCVVAGLAGPLIMYAAGTDLQGLEWEASTARGAGGGGSGSGRGNSGPAGVAATGEEARRGGDGNGSGSSCHRASPQGAPRDSGPLGVGGAAAAGRGAGPSVHVRYRGGYLPCRASLLGDQLPAEALSRVLPLHALQRAEVLCLQLPAPPPLPGLMFLECQRGGLVGAPQPVLVAPSLGVWQEVSSLAGSGAAVPGARAGAAPGMPGLLETSQGGVMQGLLLDCGMWFEFQANLQLSSMTSAAHLITQSMGEQQRVQRQPVAPAHASTRASANAAAGVAAAAAASGTAQAGAGPSEPGRQVSSAPRQPAHRSLAWLLEAEQRLDQEPGQGATHGSAASAGGESVAVAARAQERRGAAARVVPFLVDFTETAAGRHGAAETDPGAYAPYAPEATGTGSSPQAAAGAAAAWPGSEPALARARTSASGLAAAAAHAEDFMHGVSDPVGMAGAGVRELAAPGSAAAAVAAARGGGAALRLAAPAAADAVATALLRTCPQAYLLAAGAEAGVAVSRATSLSPAQTTVDLEGLYGRLSPPQGSPPAASPAVAAAPVARQPAPDTLQTAPDSATPCTLTPAGAAPAATATCAAAQHAEADSPLHGSARCSFEQPGRGRERSRGTPLSRHLQRQQPEAGRVGADPGESLLDSTFAAAMGAAERRQPQGGKGQGPGGGEYGCQRSYSELRSWDSMTDVCVEVGSSPRKSVGEAAEGQRGIHACWGEQVQQAPAAAAAAAAATVVPGAVAEPGGVCSVGVGVGGGGDVGALRVVPVGELRRSSSGSSGRPGMGESSDPIMMSSRAARAVAGAPARCTSSASAGSTQVVLRTVSSSCFLHQPHTKSYSGSSDAPHGPLSHGITRADGPAASLAADPRAMHEDVTAAAAAAPTAVAAGSAEQQPLIPTAVEDPLCDGGGGGGVHTEQGSQGHEGEQYFHDLDPSPAPHTHYYVDPDRQQQHQQQPHSARLVPQPIPAAAPGAAASTAGSAAALFAAGPAASQPMSVPHAVPTDPWVASQPAASHVGPADPWVIQPHFHTRMRHLGVQLLSFAALRGWPHTLSELLSGLARAGIDLYDADQLVGEREGGLRLLHLAVMSGRADAARAVLLAAAAAAGGGAGSGACDVAAPGPAGLTPLHLAAALEDGGQVAWVLLESSPAALRHWFSAHAADGATPADMAAQARMDGLNQLVRLRVAAVAAAAARQEAQQQQQQQQQGAQGGSSGGTGRGEEGGVAVASAFSVPAPPHGQQQRQQQEQHLLYGNEPVEQAQAVGVPDEASSSRAAASTPGAAALAELHRRKAVQHPTPTTGKYTFESGPVHPDPWSAYVDTLGEKDAAAGLSPTPVPLGGLMQLLACSLWGDVRPAMEARYRWYHAQALARVDATCGAVFVVLFALPAIGLLLSGDTSELISHLVFNAGLLGPYLLRVVRPRAFLVHRDAVMLMVEAAKLLLLLLVLSGVLPYPKAWSNFTKGNMDIVMLVIIKPLAEQTVFPVAVLQRLVGIYLDAHIYAYISYGGAMVPALVRAALQNAASLLLLLSMDVRARWVFERTAVRRKALGCSPSSSKSALGALQ